VDIVVGNPPYASIGRHDHREWLSREFSTFRGAAIRGSENLFPLFLEIAWRLANQTKCSAGWVVPISIAVSESTTLRNLRAAMTQREGEWRFAFFDREPHGLFGEEVKTRNAICFYSKPLGTSQPKFLTGPLRRWTSRTRPTLFQSIEFTPLRTGIAQGIPKIDGELEATTLLRLFRRADSMESFCSSITSCLPSAATISFRFPLLSGISRSLYVSMI